jgi:hypothetical protein
MTGPDGTHGDDVGARLAAAGIDPSSSPWPVPPVEGIPFDDDSEEARAIERIIAWSTSSDSDTRRSRLRALTLRLRPSASGRRRPDR